MLCSECPQICQSLNMSLFLSYVLLIIAIFFNYMEIVSEYEACTKFPIGGMFAALAQALHRVKLILSDCRSLAKLQLQHNVVQSKKKKRHWSIKKSLNTKSGHKWTCFLNASWFQNCAAQNTLSQRDSEWWYFKTGSWEEILSLTVMSSRKQDLFAPVWCLSSVALKVVASCTTDGSTS